MRYNTYRQEVLDLAANIVDECDRHGDYDFESDRFHDDLMEETFETVDSHQWVIYTGYALDVLSRADHDPDEWYSFVSPEDSWRKVISTMAFTAFYADVQEAVMDEYDDRLAALEAQE